MKQFEGLDGVFSHIRFASCVPSCDLSDLSPVLVDALHRLDSILCQAPNFCSVVYVNCAFRSVEHDIARGRSGKSSHCSGFAVDFSCIDHGMRVYLVHALLMAGFRRIGIARTFIHADVDPSKAESLWLYDRSNSNITF